jgi:hypothetical protein
MHTSTISYTLLISNLSPYCRRFRRATNRALCIHMLTYTPTHLLFSSLFSSQSQEVSSKDNPCTKSVQKRCLALGRASCDFGSTACGECKENYESTSTSTSSKCTYVKPDKCSASKEAHCARENKLPCTKGKNSGTCGACLEGMCKLVFLFVVVCLCIVRQSLLALPFNASKHDH